MGGVIPPRCANCVGLGSGAVNISSSKYTGSVLSRAESTSRLNSMLKLLEIFFRTSYDMNVCCLPRPLHMTNQARSLAARLRREAVTASAPAIAIQAAARRYLAKKLRRRLVTERQLSLIHI